MSDQLTISNVGPVEGEFSYEFDKPGAYELSGGPGVGKSTVLDCLNLIAGHKVTLTVNDNAPGGKGKVSGFGRSVSLGKTKRPSGELEVDTLPEKFDLSDLLTPQGKTPVTRDGNRIKVMAALTGTRVKPEDFYDLAGGEQAYKELAIEVTDDPVLFTSRVKAELDKRAKEKERQAAEKRGEQKAELAKTEGVDLAAESNMAKLAEAQEKAAAELSRLKQLRETSARQDKDRDYARLKLEEATSKYTGPTVDKADALVKEAEYRQEIANDRVEALRKQLQEAERELEKCDADVQTTKDRLATAQSHEESIATWRETLDRPIDAPPSQAEIEAAELALAKARDANNAGQRIRDAKQAKQRADERGKEAEALELRSASLRGAASQCFDVLRDAIQTEYIEIQTDADGNPRLMCDCPQRGKQTTFDHEHGGMSSAQQIMAAIQELLLKLPQTKAQRLFTVNQTDWQHLPSAHKQALDDYARSHGVFIVGARVDEGPLRVASVNGSE